MAKKNTPALVPSLPSGPVVSPHADETIMVPWTELDYDWRNNVSRLPDPSITIKAYLERVKTQPKFLSLKRSIEEKGLLSALIVRPILILVVAMLMAKLILL